MCEDWKWLLCSRLLENSLHEFPQKHFCLIISLCNYQYLLLASKSQSVNFTNYVHFSFRCQELQFIFRRNNIVKRDLLRRQEIHAHREFFKLDINLNLRCSDFFFFFSFNVRPSPDFREPKWNNNKSYSTSKKDVNLARGDFEQILSKKTYVTFFFGKK